MTDAQLSDSTRISVSPNQVSCDLAGEVAILNLASGVYYGLDAVAARVWALLQQPVTFAHVRETMLVEFDVEPGVLEADLRQLLGDLAKQGLIDLQP